MANTYSSNLRLIIQVTGENSGTWGTFVNTNFGTLVEQAIAGQAAVAVSGAADYTLTQVNGATDESRQAILSVTGTLTANINVICPALTKTYLIYNGTTGGFTITLKTPSGTGIPVPNGSRLALYCDGVNVVRSITTIDSTSIGAVTPSSGKFTALTADTNTLFVDTTNHRLGVKTLTPAVSCAVVGTDAILVPSGTTAQRPAGVNGYIRYNTDLSQVEGYIGAAWSSLGGAPLNSPAFTGTPTAPTAAFDTNTTQLATTAFVQGAGKRFSGVNFYSTNTTLTATDLNKYIECNSATAFTLTLPAASAGLLGDTINITNINIGLVTIVRAGTDTIFTTNNAGGTTLYLNAGDSLTLAIRTGSTWSRLDNGVDARIKSKATLTKTATGSLVASDLGKTLFANTASAITLTLPAANLASAGECINVTNINTGRVTISRAGTDTINARGLTGATSFFLDQGESTILAMDGTSAWYEAARGANQMTMGTNTATTSGTSIDFTGIPAWAKRITVMLNGVSVSGTSSPLIQIGNGSVVTTGYSSSAAVGSSGATISMFTSTAGFVQFSNTASYVLYGTITLVLITGNTWIATGTIGNSTTTALFTNSSGLLALGGTLDRVRLTTVNGTDTFDAGSVNISWEG